MPASKQLNVLFNAKTAGQITVSMVNSAGKTVTTQTQTIQAGNFSTVLNVANLPSGTYVVRVVTGGNTYGYKVIIAH